MKPKPAFKATKLTKKQKVFVAEYQVDLNGTQAAIRAGFSPRTAREIAYQLLHKTSHVVEAIYMAWEIPVLQFTQGFSREWTRRV